MTGVLDSNPYRVEERHKPESNDGYADEYPLSSGSANHGEQQSLRQYESHEGIVSSEGPDDVGG